MWTKRQSSSLPALACLSVDLDPLWAYQRIHGLAETQAGSGTITTLAIQRFLDLADHLGIPITFFLVTSDLEDPACAKAAKHASAQGHELANHTEDHLYDLLTRDQTTQKAQVTMAQQRIADLTGTAPVGFRAPGYGLSSVMARLIAELGYRYDSSMLPSPPYYLAKATIMAAMRLTGRPSRAHLHRPQTVLGPTGPYRLSISHPWRRGSSDLLELPVAALPGLRIPFIGTTLSLAGPSRARWLTRIASTLPVAAIECHGIDLLDQGDLPPGTGQVADHQPDLEIPWRIKRSILAETLQTLQTNHDFVTMAQAADLLHPRI